MILGIAAVALSIPLYFEPNRGQAPPETRYLAATPDYTLFLSDTGISMRLSGGGRLRMNLPRSTVRGLDALPGKANYYVGSAWLSGVPTYSRARYSAVFPGIDLVIYGKSREVEYDWVVAPGADPGAIRFSLTGASRLRVDRSGDLVIATDAGEVRHRKPYIYQIANGRTRQVEGGFVRARNGEIRFRIGPYDKRLPLVIDPQLVYANGFGGSGMAVSGPGEHNPIRDAGSAVAVDRSGNIFVAGTVYSSDFPVVPASVRPAGCSLNCSPGAVFVAKLSADGNTLLFSTVIGVRGQTNIFTGGRSLIPVGIALDPGGNVYVTGTTTGENFPLSGQASTAGGADAFLLGLDSNGALLGSTLFGGSDDDAATSIAMGADGSLYIVGTTTSGNFPTTSGAYRTTPLAAATNVFLRKVTPSPASGSKALTFDTVYSTYLGPGDSPALAVDAAGNAYVAATTSSTAWTTTPGVVQPVCANTCADIILLKLNPAGSTAIYSTYFGGAREEALGGLAVDSTGRAYVSGSTVSEDLPTTAGALQAKWNRGSPGPFAAFVTKFSPDASKLEYSTYLGGTQSDQGHAIAVDAAGRAYVAGETVSPDFPILNTIQAGLYNPVCDVYSPSGFTPIGQGYCPTGGFLSVLNPEGSALEWSTYLGSGAVRGLALDAAGDVFAAGAGVDFLSQPVDAKPVNGVAVYKIGPGDAGPQFSANGITDGASFHPGLPEPGGLASIFLYGVKVTGTVVATTFPLPTELAGVSVFVGGQPAPLLAVADIPVENPLGMQQINFQVPFNGAKSGLVEVRYQGHSTFAYPQGVAPGIFVVGDGLPAVQHAADYSLVTPANPARKGEIVVIYATGLGKVAEPVENGAAATGPNSIVYEPCAAPAVSVGTILYAGLTPGFAGLYQINVRLADNLPSGNVDLSITWNRCWLGPAPDNYRTSNVVKLAVQ